MSALRSSPNLSNRASTPSSAEEALYLRYGSQAPDAGGVWNQALSGLLAHRSIRAYRPDRIPKGALEAILAAAQSASSSSNLQTWSVVVVEDEARKARLAELAGAQKQIHQAPIFLVWLADLARAERLARLAGRPADGLPFFETFLLAAIDASLAAQNAVVALESLGLGAVYIGAIRNQPDAVAAELGLPPQVAPLFGLCIGYADAEKPAAVKPRLSQSVVVHRETYAIETEDDGIAAYDQTLREFQVSQRLPAIGWVEAVLTRLGSIKRLNGRDELKAKLRAFGFGLR
jgi:nitroreductase